MNHRGWTAIANPLFDLFEIPSGQLANFHWLYHVTATLEAVKLADTDLQHICDFLVRYQGYSIDWGIGLVLLHDLLPANFSSLHLSSLISLWCENNPLMELTH
jgi:hypothetical protein